MIKKYRILECNLSTYHIFISLYNDSIIYLISLSITYLEEKKYSSNAKQRNYDSKKNIMA